MNVNAKSMRFVLLKLANVDIASTVPKGSLPMSLVAAPLSFVDSATFPFVNYFAMILYASTAISLSLL